MADKKDEIINLQLDIIRKMTENNIRRLSDDIWGPSRQKNTSDEKPSRPKSDSGKITPAESIKKSIQISDEALDLRGEAFLQWVYDELAYRIAKKAADTLVAKIVAAGTASTSTAVGVPAITATTVSMGTIAGAIAQLSDEAANPVIIMNKLTYPVFKAVQYANGYGADPFEGLPVIFNNSLAAHGAATTGVCYAIVGDLGEGALANFPNGEEIQFKMDDVSLADADLVKITGREYVGLGIIGPQSFVKLIK